MDNNNLAIIREIDLAFVKLHILYHAAEGEVYGLGLIRELGRHGYKLSPGTLYPALGKMERLGLLTSERKTVNRKQRIYYRITPAGLTQLDKMKGKIRELYNEVVKKI